MRNKLAPLFLLSIAIFVLLISTGFSAGRITGNAVTSQTNMASCEVAGNYWCGWEGVCMTKSEPICHKFQKDCEDHGYYWCTRYGSRYLNECTASEAYCAQDIMTVAALTGQDLTQAQCTAQGFVWCATEATCLEKDKPDCYDSKTDCLAADFSWCTANSTCRYDKPGYCDNTKESCEESGRYWCTNVAVELGTEPFCITSEERCWPSDDEEVLAKIMAQEDTVAPGDQYDLSDPEECQKYLEWAGRTDQPYICYTTPAQCASKGYSWSYALEFCIPFDYKNEKQYTCINCIEQSNKKDCTANPRCVWGDYAESILNRVDTDAPQVARAANVCAYDKWLDVYGKCKGKSRFGCFFSWACGWNSAVGECRLKKPIFDENYIKDYGTDPTCQGLEIFG